MIKKIVLALIVLFVLALIFGSGDDKSTSTTSSTSNQSTEETQETTIAVTAREIFSAYESNEVAADQKYKGKLLEITGKVAGIDSGFNDNAIVNLATSNEFMNLQASGDDSFTEKAASLTKGQEVKMICRGEGEVAGFPMVGECVIN